MPYYLKLLYNVDVDPNNYERGGARFFGKRGDLDNDARWNVEEWRNVVKANDDVADMAAVGRLVIVSRDRTDDGSDGLDEIPPGKFSYGGELYDLGTPMYDYLLAQATGINTPYLTTTNVHLKSYDSVDHPDCMPITAYIVDPPGFEKVPLPVNDKDLEIALGRKIRVEVMGDTRWFKTWEAANTLVHGSPHAAEVFRLGNADQEVAARRRGHHKVSVYDAPGLTVTCTGVGELADAVYSEPKLGQGGWDLYVPEGTFLRIAVTAAEISLGKSYIPLHMFKKFGNQPISGVPTSIRSAGLYRPDGVDWVDARSGECDWGEPCIFAAYHASLVYFAHAFDGGSGGVMYAGWTAEGNRFTVGGALTHTSIYNPFFPHNFWYKWDGYPGLQFYRGRVYDSAGQLLQTDYGTTAGGEGTVSAPSMETAPIRMETDSLPKPTLTVEIEVEDDIVPPALAGYYVFDKDNYAPATKFSAYEVENPDPFPDIETELRAVTAAPHDGFVFKAWTGDCAYFDQYGNYLGMLPKTLPEDPEDWITDETIYVKCLRAEYPMMASTTSDMAVLAGASVYGAPISLVAIEGGGSLGLHLAPIVVDISLYGTSNSYFAGYAERVTDTRYPFSSGKGFLEALQDASLGAWIGHVYVFCHGWIYNSADGLAHDGGFWGASGGKGFYGVLLQSDHEDARCLGDLQSKIMKKALRLAEGDYKIFLQACHAGEIGAFAADLSAITGRTVVASCGASSEHSITSQTVTLSSEPASWAERMDGEYDGWLEGANQVGTYYTVPFPVE